MPFISKTLFDELTDLLADNFEAWDGEESSVKEEHEELITRLQDFELTAEAVTVRVVIGEHPFDPYEPMDVFVSEAGAQRRAADLTRAFLDAYWRIKHTNRTRQPVVTDNNWSEIAEKYGNDEDFIQSDGWGRWWVSIVPKEVIDA